MPLLRNGELATHDPVVHIDDGANLPDPWPDQLAVVSLGRFLQMPPEQAHHVSGISLAPADSTAALARWIDQLQLVCVEIPTFTDGRGYTHARLLRQRYGYRGEIRATGDVRPDQILHMARVGIDAFELADEPDAELMKSILARYRAYYQPSYTLPIAG